MIFGIGTDVLQLERMEQTWQRFGPRFAERLLLDEEHALFVKAKRPVRFLAMRFAAKEAIVKALGTGFANGIWIRDVGMLPNALGQPQVIFSERGRALCRKLGVGEGYLSLSDEAGLVVAVAVLMRVGARRRATAAKPKRATRATASVKSSAPKRRAPAKTRGHGQSRRAAENRGQRQARRAANTRGRRAAKDRP
ncbi:MAG TPA: holo-ACP synthase [Gammaproteobacteria bacterium]|nr:holo-ACP synthase [Gammaproteobacteria bacterium]